MQFALVLHVIGHNNNTGFKATTMTVATRVTETTMETDVNKQTNLLDDSEERERKRLCETARLSSNELDNAPVDTA